MSSARARRTPALKRTLQQLAESVEGGSTFSEALAQHPKVFNKLYVNMVRAGEAGGVLDVTLSRLADFQEKAEKIKGKVISAMVYPTVVIMVAMGIVIFLMIVVIPKFQEIFLDLLEGEKLPGVTLFVLGCSNLVKNQFPLVDRVCCRSLVRDQVPQQDGEGPLLPRQVQAERSRLRFTDSQGWHCAVYTHTGHARRERRPHFAGAEHRA